MVTFTGNASVIAYFTQNTYTIGVTIVGLGSVIKLPDQPTYTYGQVVNLSASAELGYTFTGWEGDCSGNGDCLLTIDGTSW